MVLDKDVLSQAFDEQVSNLIMDTDRENFEFSMMVMFMKMIIAYIDMICTRSKFG